MKNIISLFLILISIAGFTQDFGDPPGRQTVIQQQTIQQPYYRPQSFVVIPLYHMSPALIASIMGGEIIYDEQGSNSSGGRQNSGQSSGYSQNYGSSNRGSSRGNYNY